MNNDLYAVVIGFNEFDDKLNLPPLKYAEKDAADFCNVLSNYEVFGIPKENITLINQRKTLHEIEELLYEEIVSNRHSTDTVLVYYSGHGFYASLYDRAYLAVPDISIKQIEENPKNGLSMSWLHDDIFLSSPAKQAIFFLDCCHSGSFSPLGKLLKGKKEEVYKNLIKNEEFKTRERTAFVSSPAGVSSREDDKYQNGVFTHFLLEGLAGNARDKETGEITLSSIVNYVLPKMPDDQQALLTGTLSNFVLAPSSRERNMIMEKQFENCKILIDQGHQNKSFLSLPNPLDDHISLIDGILSNITDELSFHQIEIQILNSINQFLESDFVFIEEISGLKTKLVLQSDIRSKRINFNKIRNQIIDSYTNLLTASKDRLLESRFGVYVNLPRSKDKYCICIPLSIEQPRKFLFISGVTFDQLRYGQILGRVLISLFDATNEFSELSKVKIENIMLDDLRRWFGYVPSKIYQRRKATFLTKLETLHFYFQPIVQVKKKPFIYSWEALARDPSTNVDPTKWKAPKDLFRTAELWGPMFLKELDVFCLKNSVSEFVRLWNIERVSEKNKEPLSVNVYADTIFSEEYRNEIDRILKVDEIINPKELVLEISERRASPRPKYEDDESNNMEQFIRELTSYTKKFGISFAVDDFGIGYSSVERLANLHLKHIKIDKNVLYHEYPLTTIKYVLEMVKDFDPSPANVVIEGYDDEDNDHKINVSLTKLLENDVMFIQGHKIRRAEPTVEGLRDKEIQKILAAINKSESK